MNYAQLRGLSFSSSAFAAWAGKFKSALEPDAVMYVPHAGRPACGNTMIDGGQVNLFRLGLLPLQCKTCRENLLPFREDA